ncbi:tRNA (adenosine(37)-N6)-dimethylallyltransferase MiaA [Dehalococcoidia bacterium]|nr:tRNA (adenosine(37)-N6)-dimethylallyltransferase MiaA [Dehalococcoidia bacterium]
MDEHTHPVRLMAVVGPTAAGKSDLAMKLAETLEGEIVGADSRQVYRYMDIGTAKPSPADRARVPHHLIDVVYPDEQFGLASYLTLAKQSITNTSISGKIPILVGGTGQYIWALLEGWDVPRVPPDADTRESLESLAEVSGVSSVLRILEEIDPDAASRVDRRNPRRIIRAIEIARHGRRREPEKVPPPYETLILGLRLARSRLYERIDRRVDEMMDTGWLSEVESLLEIGYDPNLPSMSGVGYGELAAHLRGESRLDDAVQRTKYRTHRYARQQHSWFKLGDPRVHWFDVEDGADAAASIVREWLDQPALTRVDGTSTRQD